MTRKKVNDIWFYAVWNLAVAFLHLLALGLGFVAFNMLASDGNIFMVILCILWILAASASWAAAIYVTVRRFSVDGRNSN